MENEPFPHGSFTNSAGGCTTGAVLRVGLTGGIGSGKSTVAATWQALGAWVVDADAVSRALTASGGAAIEPIRQAFGPDFIAPDGALDRSRMREHVFKNAQARQQLEAILHPLVAEATRAEASRAQAAATALVLFDIPLLVESGRWRSQLDRVVVVDCLPETQVRRVVARSGLAEEEVWRIMRAQAPREQRLAAADAVVFNDGLSLEQLRTEVRALSQCFGL